MTRPLVISNGVVERSASDFAPTTDAAPCLLVFGSISTPVGTAYLYPGFGIDVANAEIKIAIPSTFVMRRMSIRARVGPQGGAQTFTVRKNGSDLSNFTAQLSTGSTGGGVVPETTTTFSLFDDLSVKSVGGTGITAGAIDVAVVLEFARA